MGTATKSERTASNRQRAWARLSIKVAATAKRKEIAEATTTPETALSGDEIVRRFKAGTLKLKKSLGRNGCGCISATTSLYDVFDVGDPYQRHNREAQNRMVRELDYAERAAIDEVSLGDKTLKQVEAIVERIRNWKVKPERLPAE